MRPAVDAAAAVATVVAPHRSAEEAASVAEPHIGVFLSYRREDSSGYAGRLYDNLTRLMPSANVFIDLKAIAPGVDFVVAIERALDACDVVLVLIGSRWVNSVDVLGNRRLGDPGDVVRMEVSAALARADVTVIPILVQGASMPAGEDLPEPLQALARRNALDLSDRHWDIDMGVLVARIGEIAAIASLVDAEQIDETTSEQVAPARVRLMRRVAVLTAMIGSALLIVALVLFLSMDHSAPGSTATIHLSAGSQPAGIEQAGGFIWTADRDGTVSQINPRGGAVNRITVGGQPEVVRAGDGALWVWNYTDAVARVDLATKAVSAPIRSAAGVITGLAVGDETLWLTHGDSGTVSRISTRSLLPIGEPIRVGTRPGATVFDNHRLYVVDRQTSALVALDGTTGRPLNDPLVLRGPVGGVVADGGVLWVGSTDVLTPVDEATFVVGQPLPLPQVGLFDVGDGVLWASYPFEDVIRRIDLRTRAPMGQPVADVGRDLTESVLADGELWATRARTDDVVRVSSGG